MAPTIDQDKLARFKGAFASREAQGKAGLAAGEKSNERSKSRGQKAPPTLDQELDALLEKIKERRQQIADEQDPKKRRNKKSHLRRRELKRLPKLIEAVNTVGLAHKAQQVYDEARRELLDDDALDLGVVVTMSQLGPKAGKKEQEEKDALRIALAAEKPNPAQKKLCAEFQKRWEGLVAELLEVNDVANAGQHANAAAIRRLIEDQPTDMTDPDNLDKLKDVVSRAKKLGAVSEPDATFEKIFEANDRNWFTITKKHKAGDVSKTDMQLYWDWRDAVVAEMLADLEREYPGVQFAAVGSTTLTSDIDVGVLSHGTTNNGTETFFDWQIVQEFNRRFEARFHQVPGIYFDVNLYASAPRVSPIEAIEDPQLRENMQSMANSGQDVGALMKLRRHLSWDEYWTQMESVLSKMTDKVLIETTRRQYEEADSLYFLSIKRTLDSFTGKDKAVNRLVEAAQSQIKSVNLGDLEAMKAAQVVVEATITEIEHDHPAAMMAVTNAIYDDAVREVRKLEVELLKLQQIKEKLEGEAPPDDIAIADVNDQIAGLAARIPTFYADAVFFANEAYHTTGPYEHIVEATQGVEFAFSAGKVDGWSKSDWEEETKKAKASGGKLTDKQKKALETERTMRRSALTIDQCMGSFNEQLGDVLKDFKHYHDKNDGFAFTKASKYLQRFFDSLELVQDLLSGMDWSAVNNAIGGSPHEQAEAVGADILPVRKGDKPAGQGDIDSDSWVMAKIVEHFEWESTDDARKALLEVGNMVNAAAREVMRLKADSEEAYFKSFQTDHEDVA